MHRIAIALTLLLAAGCSDPEADDTAGTSGGESSSGETTDGETDEGESSGADEAWLGETVSVRLMERVGDPALTSCLEACGSSACLFAVNTLEMEPTTCEYDDNFVDCTCGDFADEETAASTHAVSEAFLNPNADVSGFDMSRPDPWTGGPCGQWCGDNALGECLGTLWAEGDRELPVVGADGELEYTFFPSAPTTRPEEIAGPAGVFRFICEL